MKKYMTEIKNWTVAEFREWILNDNTTGEILEEFQED